MLSRPSDLCERVERVWGQLPVAFGALEPCGERCGERGHGLLDNGPHRRIAFASALPTSHIPHGMTR